MNIFENEETGMEVEKINDSDGLLTFKIKVKSYEFSGPSYFETAFETTNGKIKDVRKLLKDMDETLKGDVTISDLESGNFLKLEMKELGHILCSGEVKFSFLADQTILKRLISVLR